MYAHPVLAKADRALRVMSIGHRVLKEQGFRGTPMHDRVEPVLGFSLNQP